MDVHYPSSPYEMLTRPLVEAWVELIERAGDARKEFIEQADMCEAFYARASGFMWKADFKNRFIGEDVPVPQYNVTVNTAFEFVSRFMPRLYWQNPRRSVTRPARPDIDLEAVVTPEESVLLERFVQEQALHDRRVQQANMLWETYLNYTPNEMPGGGLEQHSRASLHEALLTGRGMLVPRTYTIPGTDRMLTGCFHKSVRDLFIDPDCGDPLLSDAKWIVLQHVTEHRKLERMFGWPKDSLRCKGHFASGASQAVRSRRQSQASEDPKDLVVWYEVWSTSGVGARFTATKMVNRDVWDDLVGDYAYLCITPKVPSPLNCPAWWMQRDDVSDDDVRAALSWPVEYWRDNRWPVSLLDFHLNDRSAWPLAHLSAAMGEMITLQILLSLYLQNAQANTQQIIAYLDSAASQVEAKINSGDPIVTIKLVDGLQKSITDVVSFLNRPNMNTDLIEAINFVLVIIARKTGLSPYMYGDNPNDKVSRSAADASFKAENVGMIPAYMGKQVAAWQADAADKERLTAYSAGIDGRQLSSLLGPAGALAWDRLVLGEPVEDVFRGQRCRVVVSDMQRPDKDRDTDNLQQLSGYIVPALMQYGQSTGDFRPWNGYIKAIGDAMEVETEEWRIPDQMPQSERDAQVEQNAQAAMKDRELEMKLAAQQAQMDMKAQAAEQALMQKEEQHQQKMQHDEQYFWQRLQSRAAERALKGAMNGVL